MFVFRYSSEEDRVDEGSSVRAEALTEADLVFCGSYEPPPFSDLPLLRSDVAADSLPRSA